MRHSELWLWFMNGALGNEQNTATELGIHNAARMADFAIKEYRARFGQGSVVDDRDIKPSGSA